MLIGTGKTFLPSVWSFQQQKNDNISDNILSDNILLSGIMMLSDNKMLSAD
jgi:hypothetical protein